MAGGSLGLVLWRVVAAGMWIGYSTEAVGDVEAMVGETVQEERGELRRGQGLGLWAS